MKFSEHIKKLQNLPENKKKIILWTIVIILGLALSFFWIRATVNRLSHIDIGGISGPIGSILEKPIVDDKNLQELDEKGKEVLDNLNKLEEAAQEQK
jgi:Cu/Ag efflux pump CusA